jgi:anti-sigma B factor antagonist
MSAPLHITQRSAGGTIIFELHGRLIFEDGDEVLRDCIRSLIKTGPLSLLVDLQDVSYMDSAGIGALVEGYLRLTRRGGEMKLLRPSDHVRRVLDITRLSTVLDIYDDEAIALRTFNHVPA